MIVFFAAFFARPDLIRVEMTREVIELAAAIRVKHGLRTPDALRAASCLQLGLRGGMVVSADNRPQPDNPQSSLAAAQMVTTQRERALAAQKPISATRHKRPLSKADTLSEAITCLMAIAGGQ